MSENTYKVMRMIDGDVSGIPLPSRYALKQWCRMNGYAMSGIVTGNGELQGHLRFNGLAGPFVDGTEPDGRVRIRYEDDAAHDALSQ